MLSASNHLPILRSEIKTIHDRNELFLLIQLQSIMTSCSQGNYSYDCWHLIEHSLSLPIFSIIKDWWADSLAETCWLRSVDWITADLGSVFIDKKHGGANLSDTFHSSFFSAGRLSEGAESSTKTLSSMLKTVLQ